MKNNALVMLVFATLVYGCVSTTAQDIPSIEDQIAAAVQSIPEEQRAGATVLGYSPESEGQLVVIRQGTNNMVCVGDDPNKAGFHAAAYHKSLSAFMERGRELKAEGKDRGEVFAFREKEAKEGALTLPTAGATLHVLSGEEGFFNAETNMVEKVSLRYVVYLPWATAASTGLPIRPEVAGGPWIMDPGTHRAHIMISPPQ